MMKRTLMALAAMLLAAGTFAQTTDSTSNIGADTTDRSEPDTLRVGNFIIVKQSRNRGLHNGTDKDRRVIVITRSRRHEYDSSYTPSAFTTNWLVFDLGFANIDDKPIIQKPTTVTICTGMRAECRIPKVI